MRIVYSRHAIRGIAALWVETALAAPDRKEPDPSDPEFLRVFKVIPEAGNRVLRVVYAQRGEGDIFIVTAFLDRGAAV